ncbi:MAG: fructosamine kinase family protein [Myxococcota bacterium]|nr:fructosamine kinase family protein [Myxococcota bacterium]
MLASPIADDVAKLAGGRVARTERLHGGDINDAHLVALADGRELFVKSNTRAPRMMFQREAEGLEWLGAANALRVPKVVGIGERVLVLELIRPAERRRDFDEQLGRGLAALHLSGAGTYGLATDNYIGTLPQSNRAHPTWADFYRDERLTPLIQRAGDVFSPLDRRIFDRLLERMRPLVGEVDRPSRLHGDLWGGNLLTDEQGAPVLIDPAAYGGDREIDLAMMQLFGGFSARVFAAYAEAAPLRDGWKERVKLYQLYPLLVHANLFGGSYVTSAVEAAKTYI